MKTTVTRWRSRTYPGTKQAQQYQVGESEVMFVRFSYPDGTATIFSDGESDWGDFTLENIKVLRAEVPGITMVEGFIRLEGGGSEDVYVPEKWTVSTTDD